MGIRPLRLSSLFLLTVRWKYRFSVAVFSILLLPRLQPLFPLATFACFFCHRQEHEKRSNKKKTTAKLDGRFMLSAFFASADPESGPRRGKTFREYETRLQFRHSLRQHDCRMTIPRHNGREKAHKNIERLKLFSRDFISLSERSGARGVGRNSSRFISILVFVSTFFILHSAVIVLEANIGIGLRRRLIARWLRKFTLFS